MLERKKTVKNTQEIKSIINPLEKKVINIKFIEERFDTRLKYANENHDGLYRFSGTSENFVLRLSVWRTRFNELLSEEQQRFFENKLSLHEGALNPYAKGKDNFWNSFVVKVDKYGITLNLELPEDYLKFLVMKTQPVVAPNYESRFDKADYRYYISEKGQSERKAASIGKLKGQAYAELSKIENKKQLMLDILRLMNKPVATGISEEEVYGTLVDIIETADQRAQYNASKFLNAINDPDKEQKLFIINAKITRDLQVKGKAYIRTKDNQVIAHSEESMIEFYNTAEGDNKEWLEIVKERIRHELY